MVRNAAIRLVSMGRFGIFCSDNIFIPGHYNCWSYMDMEMIE